MSRAWVLILLGGAAIACGGHSPPGPDTKESACQRARGRLRALTRRVDPERIRTASRSDVEQLQVAMVRMGARCGEGKTAREARWKLAWLRDRVARATGDDQDLQRALRTWAELAASSDATPLSARARWRQAALELDFDRREQGFGLLGRLAETYPEAPAGQRALRAMDILAPLAPDLEIQPRPGPRTKEAADSELSGHAVDPERLGIQIVADHGRPARLVRVRRWSTPTFSRVVAYFDRPVRFAHGALPASGGRPARLYLDFAASVLHARVERVDPARMHLLRGLRLANRPPASVRLVTDLAGPLRYEIYPLRHPYRVVVDLWKPGASPHQPGSSRPPAIRVVALDPGHGGPNRGAVGPSGLAEKDVTLPIAREAARLLEARGLKAVLTRESDQPVSLEERSAVALAVGADIFVSIHANAEPTGRRMGIETYYLDVESDEYAARLAARENQAAGRAVSSYRLGLADLTTRAHTARSARLAEAVQARLVEAAREQRPKIPDRGVRRAIFYVLLTARVPGILTEVSFISSRAGAAALARPEYQRLIGQGIARGILEFSGRRPSSSGPARREAPPERRR